MQSVNALYQYPNPQMELRTKLLSWEIDKKDKMWYLYYFILHTTHISIFVLRTTEQISTVTNHAYMPGWVGSDNWKSKTVMMSTLSSMAAPEVVIKTTSGAASDDKAAVTTTADNDDRVAVTTTSSEKSLDGVNGINDWYCVMMFVMMFCWSLVWQAGCCT